MNKKPFKPIGPFRGWVIENFPFIEDDFDAITTYQLLCKIVEYINKIAYNEELLEDANDELIDKFNELKSYVDNYFENLDIQEEINNKLDEMAESGELTDIIAQYLQLAGILAFNTLSDLANAENLSNGSFTKTYGKTTYNDGDGAFYKIRTLINTDVIDGDNLVALVNYPTLVAEKMKDNQILELFNDIQEINTNIGDLDNLDTTDKSSIVNAINEVNAKTQEKEDVYLLIGDSYGRGYTPDGMVTGWCELLKAKLGLDNDHCYIMARDGHGFANNLLFLDELEIFAETITNKEDITKIILCSGYTDVLSSQSDIHDGILAFRNYVTTTFPNATLYLGMIGYSTAVAGNRSKIYNNVLPAYLDLYDIPNTRYLNGVEYASINNTMSSDGIHPNQDGEYNICEAIYNSYLTGYASYKDSNTITINYVSQVTSHSGGLYEYKNNQSVTLYEAGLTIKGTNIPVIQGEANKFKLGDIQSRFIYPLDDHSTAFPVSGFVVDSSNNFHGGGFLLEINTNNELILYMSNFNGNNWAYNSLKEIWLYPTSVEFNTFYF